MILTIIKIWVLFSVGWFAWAITGYWGARMMIERTEDPNASETPGETITNAWTEESRH